MRTRSGFTLVELLVVMAIAAVLMSMLLPGLDLARRKGRSAVCMGNLRQIGVAMENYQQDNQGFIPKLLSRAEPGRPWAEDSLVAGVLAATAHAQPAPAANPYSFAPYCRDSGILVCPEQRGRPGGSYGRNGQIRVTTFSQIPQPSEMPLVLDCPIDPGYYYSDLDYRHIGSANCLYVDSHVAGVSLNPVSVVAMLPLPGLPPGAQFRLWIEVQGTHWDAVGVSIAEDGNEVGSARVTRNPTGGNRQTFDLGTFKLDPVRRVCRMTLRLEGPGITADSVSAGQANVHVSMRVFDGAWIYLAHLRSHSPDATADITAALRAAM